MVNHVQVDPSRFDPASIPKATQEFNKKLMNIMAGAPRWFDVGAEKYRQMRAAGQTPLPAAVLLDTAETSSIPSRDQGRSIPTRIFKPEDTQPTKGVFMHIHGGGWVLQDEKSQDPMLQYIASSTGLTIVSIGYRLAPEHPYPAGPNDCFDAAEWLIENAPSTFNTTLKFIGGESAGGHLAMSTILHILQHPDPKFSTDFKLQGALLHFGVYDLTFTPSVYTFQKPETLILDGEIMEHYRDAFLPGGSLQKYKDPTVSPMYADLGKLRGRLPPALFTCGTEDPLLDDTVFMSARYQAVGADTTVKIFPGAAHGYIMFPRENKATLSQLGLDEVTSFVQRTIS